MSGKRLSTKQKSAAARAVQKTKILRPEFSPEEVLSFEQQLARHQQSESAWQRLAAHPDDDDRWGEIEDHLLSKAQKDDHAPKRWKYFSK